MKKIWLLQQCPTTLRFNASWQCLCTLFFSVLSFSFVLGQPQLKVTIKTEEALENGAGWKVRGVHADSDDWQKSGDIVNIPKGIKRVFVDFNNANQWVPKERAILSPEIKSDSKIELTNSYEEWALINVHIEPQQAASSARWVWAASGARRSRGPFKSGESFLARPSSESSPTSYNVAATPVLEFYTPLRMTISPEPGLQDLTIRYIPVREPYNVLTAKSQHLLIKASTERIRRQGNIHDNLVISTYEAGSGELINTFKQEGADIGHGDRSFFARAAVFHKGVFLVAGFASFVSIPNGNPALDFKIDRDTVVSPPGVKSSGLGLVYSSTNGIDWEATVVSTNRILSMTANDEVVVVSGKNGLVASSQDAGETWTVTYLPDRRPAYQEVFEVNDKFIANQYTPSYFPSHASSSDGIIWNQYDREYSGPFPNDSPDQSIIISIEVKVRGKVDLMFTRNGTNLSIEELQQLEIQYTDDFVNWIPAKEKEVLLSRLRLSKEPTKRHRFFRVR